MRAALEPLDRAVYVGRTRLGRYRRVSGDDAFEAFDADDKPLGLHSSVADALVAIDRASQNGGQR